MKLKYTLLPLMLMSSIIRADGGLMGFIFGNWTVGVRGGIFPSFYTDRGTSYIYSAADEDSLQKLPYSVPKFLKQFGMPWYVQGEFLRQICDDRVGLFADAAYIQAKGKSLTSTTQNLTGESVSLAQSFNDFKMGQVRVGGRYYWKLCHEWLTPYAGFNTGLQFRSKVKSTIDQVVDEETTTYLSVPYKNTTGVTGALHGGLTFFDNCRLSFHFHVELAFSSALANSETLLATPTDAAVAPGRTGTIISIPVAFGAAVNF